MGTPASELAEHKRIIREQSIEIEALKKKKEHWENQYIIENKKWKFAEKSFSDLLIRTVNNTYPVKDLTDKEVNKLWKKSHEDGVAMQQGFTTQQHYFAHLLLKKASEK